MIYRIKHPMVTRLHRDLFPAKWKNQPLGYEAIVDTVRKVLETLVALDLTNTQRTIFMEVLLQAADQGNRLTPEDLQGFSFVPQLDTWVSLGLLEALDEGGNPLSPEIVAQRVRQSPPGRRRGAPKAPPVASADVERVMGVYAKVGAKALGKPLSAAKTKLTKNKIKIIEHAINVHDVESAMRAAGNGWLDPWNMSTGNTSITWFLRIDEKYDNVERFSEPPRENR